MSTYFSGKSVLITGASSGIGAALSRILATQGAKLILVARNTDSLNTLKTELEALAETRAEVEVHSLDISDENAVRDFASRIDTNRIDVLINNAGIVCCDQIENLSETDFRSMINTNCLGQIWMTRAILPAMKTRRSGQIINIASMAGIIGIAGYTAYSASKYALVGFTESLRNELSGTGVGISLVLPSDVDTPQFHKENQTKPEATKALSGSIEPLSAEIAAEKILTAITSRKKEILIAPFYGRFQFWLYRAFPSISRKVIDRVTSKYN